MEGNLDTNQLNYPQNKIRYPRLNGKFTGVSIINPSVVIPRAVRAFYTITQLS